jgi:hypothetical protein
MRGSGGLGRAVPVLVEQRGGESDANSQGVLVDVEVRLVQSGLPSTRNLGLIAEAVGAAGTPGNYPEAAATALPVDRAKFGCTSASARMP